MRRGSAEAVRDPATEAILDTRGARGCPRALNGRPGTPGLLTPDGLGTERESHLPAMPGELAGQSVTRIAIWIVTQALGPYIRRLR
jgi:hypothetical protein